MTRILMIPGLICDGHVWRAAHAALADYDVVVADVTHQPSITAMAEDLLARTPGDLVAIGHSMGARVQCSSPACISKSKAVLLGWCTAITTAPIAPDPPPASPEGGNGGGFVAQAGVGPDDYRHHDLLVPDKAAPARQRLAMDRGPRHATDPRYGPDNPRWSCPVQA